MKKRAIVFWAMFLAVVGFLLPAPFYETQISSAHLSGPSNYWIDQVLGVINCILVVSAVVSSLIASILIFRKIPSGFNFWCIALVGFALIGIQITPLNQPIVAAIFGTSILLQLILMVLFQKANSW